MIARLHMTRLAAALALIALGLPGPGLAGAGAGARARADGQRWSVYANVRYRYQICYPADLLRPQGEADNGDGQSFTAKDGATLSVFGRNAVDAATLGQTVERDAAALTGPRGAIRYRLARPDWAVVSGDDGGTDLFYSKTIRRGDQFLIFELRYPKAAQDRYGPVVTRLSRCFASAR